MVAHKFEKNRLVGLLGPDKNKAMVGYFNMSTYFETLI